MARRTETLAGLAALLPTEGLVEGGDERRAFETDGITARRQVPLAVVPPRSTEQVSNVVGVLHREGFGDRITRGS